MNTYTINRSYDSFPSELLITRHGESLRNVTLEKTKTGLFYDTPAELEKFGKIPDHKIPLTEKGKLQARSAGCNIVDEASISALPEICIHSGYDRAHTTAKIITGVIQEKTGVIVPIIENYSLRERESGITHVMLASEVEELLKWNKRYWHIVGSVFGCPLSGESLATLREGRIRSVLRDDLRQFAGKRVMLVCHGRVMQAIHMELLNMTISEMEGYMKLPAPENCEVRRYITAG